MDRRSGFDRRSARGILPAFLSPLGFALLLAGINLLNLADYLCTLAALRAGFREGNPLMDRLFAHSPAVAGLVKLVLVGLVSALLWRLRRFRTSILAALLMLGLLAAVFGWHTAGLLVLR